MSAEEATRYSGALARAAAAALGDTVAAVILHGSLALGDYLPGRSDVDLLAVVDDPLDDARVDALTGAMAAEPPPARVDLRVVTRQVAAATAPAPPMEAYLALTPGSGVQVERRHPGERDPVVELAVCRAHGRSLLGAPPAELIGEVPPAWVVACRIWRLAEEGRHCSKAAAGAWALRRDPTLQVIRDAPRQRHDPAWPIDPDQVQRLLGTVRARLAGGAG
jgi:hypothetical protein